MESWVYLWDISKKMILIALCFQARFHPNPQYMKKQPDITEGMRSILVDWLVEVAEEFKLDQNTLHMSITIVDRSVCN